MPRPGALGDPQVRKLWAATLAQSLAVWIAQIALIVGVLEHQDGSSLAWVMLASSMPALLTGLAAGTIVVRHDPRRVAQAGATAGVVLLVGAASVSPTHWRQEPRATPYSSWSAG